MSKIKLNSGTYYDFLQPTADMVLLEDIVHNLSKEQRFSNCLDSDWSVLQHILLVYSITKQLGGGVKDQYQALHHDDPEAYFKDVPTPLKELLRDYGRLYNLSASIIGDKFNTNLISLSPIVKTADKKAMYIEDLMLCNEPSSWHDYTKEDYRNEDVQVKEDFTQLQSMSRESLKASYIELHKLHCKALKIDNYANTAV